MQPQELEAQLAQTVSVWPWRKLSSTTKGIGGLLPYVREGAMLNGVFSGFAPSADDEAKLIGS